MTSFVDFIEHRSINNNASIHEDSDDDLAMHKRSLVRSTTKPKDLNSRKGTLEHGDTEEGALPHVVKEDRAFGTSQGASHKLVDFGEQVTLKHEQKQEFFNKTFD